MVETHTRHAASLLASQPARGGQLNGFREAAASTDREAASMSEEDRLRAASYGLIGRLLARVPDRETLLALSSIEGDAAAEGLKGAWAALGVAARSATPADLEREYQELFIGIGRGELVPFASWYLTGFLMERPLGVLRDDLASLGIARQESVREPEDHIAALCEVMAILITDDSVGADRAVEFHRKHLAPWAPRFFGDLERARSAQFYRHVGRLGRAFLDLERITIGAPA